MDNESSYFTERPILLVAGLFVLAAIPIVFFFIMMYGSVVGKEFSPDDFTRREFSYQQVPWLEWTYSGIEYTDVTTEIEQTLVTNGLITPKTPKPGQPKTWHLYYDSGVPNSHQCDTRFLTSYLDFSDWDSKTATSKPYWLNWNEDFPSSAKIFWPTVADLARYEMYLVMPDIMRFALNTTEDKPKKFQQKLNRLLYSSWISAAKADLQSGNYEVAVARLLRAQLIDATDEVTHLIGLSKQQIEDFSELETSAKTAAEELANEIVEALAKSDELDTEKPISAETTTSSEPPKSAEKTVP